jgi:hypothetical protein
MPTGAYMGEATIEGWMSAIVMERGVLRFDDLHIDQIDSTWKHRDQWIEGGREAFRMAIGVRNRNQLPFVVGLGFSLESGGKALGIDFRTKQELHAKLDSSPPSLYLFRRGGEPRTQVSAAEGTVQYFDPAMLGALGDVLCYYLEFKQPGFTKFYRSAFVEG